jgi:hypothetical protein
MKWWNKILKKLKVSKRIIDKKKKKKKPENKTKDHSFAFFLSTARNVSSSIEKRTEKQRFSLVYFIV